MCQCKKCRYSSCDCDIIGGGCNDNNIKIRYTEASSLSSSSSSLHNKQTVEPLKNSSVRWFQFVTCSDLLGLLRFKIHLSLSPFFIQCTHLYQKINTQSEKEMDRIFFDDDAHVIYHHYHLFCIKKGCKLQ